jgi:hypothetical protein
VPAYVTRVYRTISDAMAMNGLGQLNILGLPPVLVGTRRVQIHGCIFLTLISFMMKVQGFCGGGEGEFNGKGWVVEMKGLLRKFRQVTWCSSLWRDVL